MAVFPKLPVQMSRQTAIAPKSWVLPGGATASGQTNVQNSGSVSIPAGAPAMPPPGKAAY